jgi:hypothetical protein
MLLTRFHYPRFVIFAVSVHCDEECRFSDSVHARNYCACAVSYAGNSLTRCAILKEPKRSLLPRHHGSCPVNVIPVSRIFGTRGNSEPCNFRVYRRVSCILLNHTCFAIAVSILKVMCKLNSHISSKHNYSKG